MTTAWFHCFSGIAGDMALGSLIDAGADLDEVIALLERLPVSGWELDARAVMRCGLKATRVEVTATDRVVVRTHAHIQGLIEEARLPDRVRDRALATFANLAEVEGNLHRRHPSQVHFHEVGALDSIIDTVGVCAALEVLDVDDVRASAVATGTGMVRTAHGLLPNPVPAVVELLRGAPTYGLDLPWELTTPTGAALLSTLGAGWGPMPPMTIDATGFGAGSREIDGMPNVTQVILGTLMELDGQATGQPLVQLDANVDDATGETIAHALATLLEAGALDAWVTPIVMKKGRPAHTISALVDVALVRQVAEVIARETGSLGVRGTTVERWPAAREMHEVELDGMPVRIKVSPGRAKVEHDDAAKIARRTGAPLREVVRRAEQAWHLRSVDTPPAPVDPRDGGIPPLALHPADPSDGGDDAS